MPAAASPNAVTITPIERYKERVYSRRIFSNENVVSGCFRAKIDWRKTNWTEWLSGTWGINTVLWLLGRSCYRDFSEDYHKYCIECLLDIFFKDYVSPDLCDLNSYGQARRFLYDKLINTPQLIERTIALDLLDSDLSKELLYGAVPDLRNAYKNKTVTNPDDFKLKDEYRAHSIDIFLGKLKTDFEPFAEGVPGVVQNCMVDALDKLTEFQTSIEFIQHIDTQKQSRLYNQAKPEFLKAVVDKIDSNDLPLDDMIALKTALAVCYEKGIGVTVPDKNLCHYYYGEAVIGKMINFQKKWAPILQHVTHEFDCSVMSSELESIKKQYEKVSQSAQESGKGWPNRMEVAFDFANVNLLAQHLLHGYTLACHMKEGINETEKAELAFEAASFYESGVSIRLKVFNAQLPVVITEPYGFKPNLKLAFNFYSNAVENDPKHAKALEKLEYFYIHGLGGCGKDEHKAQEYRQRINEILSKKNKNDQK